MHIVGVVSLIIKHVVFPGPNVIVIALSIAHTREKATHAFVYDEIPRVAPELIWCLLDKLENIGRDGNRNRGGERGARDENISAVPARRDSAAQGGKVVHELVAWRVEVGRARPIIVCGVDGEDASLPGRVRPLTVAPRIGCRSKDELPTRNDAFYNWLHLVLGRLVEAE